MKIKKINVHLTEEQIEQRVRELGAEISNCLLYTSDAADE